MGEMAVLMALAVTKAIPARPEEQIPSASQHGDTLWSLLTRCWAREPGDRPSSAAAVDIVSSYNNYGATSILILESQMKKITREGLTHVPTTETPDV
jgi:hypothetical protein